MELFVAQNLALDGMLYPLIYGAYVDEHLTIKGGTAIAMLTSFMPEWHDETVRWVDAVVKAAAAESEANKNLLTEWTHVWTDRVQAALAPVAEIALGDLGQDALAATRSTFNARVAKTGLAI
jgi:phenol hydroxylase P1 protein